MSQPLASALAQLRGHMLDPEALVRAVASGKQRAGTPPWRRVELRPVDLKAGRHVQVVRYDATQAHTANHLTGEAAATVVDELLALPFGNWLVETTSQTHHLRVTKKGEALLVSKAAEQPREASLSHDRAKQRMLPEDHRVLVALGISDAQGRIKPTRQAKYRQVEEFVRLLDAAIGDAIDSGALRTPSETEPLRIVDLGCGNAYLTFAAWAYLSEVKGLPVHITGVDVKQQSADHNSGVAAQLGIDADFVVGTIEGAPWTGPEPEVVLALHACDTATDDALARALGWQAPLVLAAPCCHHDISAQLRRNQPHGGSSLLTRHGILRERFADTLTDALRAALLQINGYKVDVVEFVESAHTPRNTLLRAARSGAPADAGEYQSLVEQWHVQPRLADLLAAAPTRA